MADTQNIPVDELVRAMSDTVPVLIWMDNPDKTPCFFNKGWLDFTGRSLEEEIGHGWAQAVHPDDRERCTEVYNASFDKRIPFSLEYRLRRHDGEYRWFLDKGMPRYDARGNFGGYTGCCTDIEERKEAETAKDELMSIAGHELKTPLTTLMVSVQMLEKLFSTSPPSAYIPELLRTSAGSLKKLELLINDLLHVGLALDGRMSVQKDLFPISNVMDECRQFFKLTSVKKLVINGDTGITLFADAKKIEQVLMNLLNNALKYAPASEAIHINIEEMDQFLKVIVQDFGPGIAPESIGFIFDRYYRVGRDKHKRVAGSGLGLYISREIIHQHGGEMGVDSKPGEGTAFWFTLPLVTAEQN